MRPNVANDDVPPAKKSRTEHIANGVTFKLKIANAIKGMCVGDALSVPLHWYYDFGCLEKHTSMYYSTQKSNRITQYHAVHPELRSKHPSSEPYYSQLDTRAEPIDYFNGKHEQWKVKDIHYHPDLKAGENTTTTQLALVAIRSIVECSGYDVDNFLQRYINYFTKSGGNSDTYIEVVHRHFFNKLSQGTPRHLCGKPDEGCLSLLTIALPVILLELTQGSLLATVVEKARRHTALLGSSNNSIITSRWSCGCCTTYYSMLVMSRRCLLPRSTPSYLSVRATTWKR
eukprot:m.68487 g.68487  ORF g.68487 m.68487 type:complete len:286 (+) comp23960_c0_seq1:146-1003(+)